MLRKTLTILTMMTCLSACSGIKQTLESNSTSAVAISQSTPAGEPAPAKSDFIERCIADASKPEMKLKVMGDLPVYSRTGDFDGNGKEDVAVLVVSESEPMKGGLLVCRNGDSRSSSTFGTLFKSARLLSSFKDDNFITSEWEVVLKTESPKIALGPDGKSRIKNQNKGDVIAFFHEGGAVFIFWDGSGFRLVEGG